MSSGAMENWGLITYRESCLLLDPENTSTMNKQFIALVVGHEVAHQWFGNLVTMVSCKWRPPSLSKLTPIIFYMELNSLCSEASKFSQPIHPIG